MKRKNPFRLRMDFDGIWINGAAALMGAAFFLRAVYYFGIRGLGENLGTLLLMMAFPMIVEAALAVMVRLARPNIPLVFGVICAVYCVLLLIQCFFYGAVLRTVIGIVAYPICAVALMALIFGLLRNRALVFVVFFATFAVRFLLFDLNDLQSFRLPEAAALCGILAMAMVPLGMKVIKKAPRQTAKSE